MIVSWNRSKLKCFAAEKMTKYFFSIIPRVLKERVRCTFNVKVRVCVCVCVFEFVQCLPLSNHWSMIVSRGDHNLLDPLCWDTHTHTHIDGIWRRPFKGGDNILHLILSQIQQNKTVIFTFCKLYPHFQSLQFQLFNKWKIVTKSGFFYNC